MYDTWLFKNRNSFMQNTIIVVNIIYKYKNDEGGGQKVR